MSRKHRIRAKVSGTLERPRLAIYRSNRALSVQVVDDTKHVTLLSARVTPSNKTTAKALGDDIAKKLKDKGITTLVFDRGGYQYHGTIQTFADAARQGGIKF